MEAPVELVAHVAAPVGLAAIVAAAMVEAAVVAAAATAATPPVVGVNRRRGQRPHPIRCCR